MYLTEDKNEYVKQVQRMLLDIAYRENIEEKLPIDGVYSSQTRNAVSDFQRKKGVLETGQVDKLTFDLLCAENQQKTNAGAVFPLAVGSAGPFVEILQSLLSALSYLQGKEPDTYRRGYFSNATENAVLGAQKMFGDCQDGKVSKDFLLNLFDYVLKKQEQSENPR